MVCDLTVGHAQDVYELDSHFLARRRYSEKLSLVRTIECLAGHHLVILSNQVVNDSTEIREGVAEHGKELSDSFTVRWESRRSAVVNKTIGQKLVYRRVIALFSSGDIG
jgi:hypothetical protein